MDGFEFPPTQPVYRSGERVPYSGIVREYNGPLRATVVRDEPFPPSASGWVYVEYTQWERYLMGLLP